MSTLFFYGTLRHIPLLEIVLGRAITPDQISNGIAKDHAVYAVKNADYPIIAPLDLPSDAPDPSGAKGILVSDLSEADIARLDFYEGGYDYALTYIVVQSDQGPMPAQIYFPRPERFEPVGLWDFDNWLTNWGEMTCLAATEAMSYFGQKTDAELEFMYPSLRARAASKLAAQRESLAHSPSGYLRDDVRPDPMKRCYTGYFTLEEHRVYHKTYAGGESGLVQREVFVGADAAILLPYDVRRDRVMLIEQFRAGPWARHDANPWMLEPIAGRIDPGESPEDTARREAQEEAKIDITTLHHIAKVYASPGCSTEFFHIFVGEADLPDDITGVAGLASEAEDIKSYLFDFDSLMEMVDRYQAGNAPLVLAALWLARKRDALRRTA